MIMVNVNGYIHKISIFPGLIQRPKGVRTYTNHNPSKLHPLNRNSKHGSATCFPSITQPINARPSTIMVAGLGFGVPRCCQPYINIGDGMIYIVLSVFLIDAGVGLVMLAR